MIPVAIRRVARRSEQWWNKDEVRGKAERAKGRVKEGVGIADQTEGAVEERFGTLMC
jgi:uncharacterized protein YjbJ (UPF0337 family)